ncbi:MAG: hemerythrin domain-containing protein [Streptosporangiaceae bacterium]|nr:hemerythrin domain-containing protein [Streptosporangiaceae bacterium]
MSTSPATGQRSRPDDLIVTLVHQSLRDDAARLAGALAAVGPGDRPGRVAAIGACYGQYRGQLDLHHRHEDELFFPALAARVGSEAMHLDELTAQHHALDTALQAVCDRLAALADPAGDFGADHAGAVAALSAMTELLLAHLTLEEKHALPLYQTEITAAENRELEARARKATPRDRARFMIPWLVTHADQDQRTALFRSIPPLRLLYWLNLRYYRRFEAALAPAA